MLCQVNMAESMIIIAATASSAVVIVVVIICIGCIYLHTTQKKSDTETPNQYTKCNSGKPRFIFPEKLETLGAYFEQHESDESRMFVTKIRISEINIKEGKKAEPENIQNHHYVEQDMRIVLLEEEANRNNNKITTAGTETTGNAEQGVNETENSDESMQEINDRTNIAKSVIEYEEETDIGIHLYTKRFSAESVDLDVGSMTSEESCGEEACETSNATSSKLEEIDISQKETKDVSIEMDTPFADRSGECVPVYRSNDSNLKLQFLETILKTNSPVDLPEEKQTTGHKKKSKRQRKEIHLKNFQIGQFRYYLVRVQQKLKRSKKKKTSRVSPTKSHEQLKRRKSSSSRCRTSYPSPESRMGKDGAHQNHMNHTSFVEIPTTGASQNETDDITTFRKASDSSKTNKLTNKSRSINSTARCNSAVSCHSQPSCRSVSMKDINFDYDVLL